jgi:hypothetical protein
VRNPSVDVYMAKEQKRSKPKKMNNGPPKKDGKMRRFRPETYDPQDDSSAGAPARPGVITLRVPKGSCHCGCGEMAPVSKPNARFRSGHDARLQGILIRAVTCEVTIALVTEAGETMYDPKDYAALFTTELRDWREHVTAAAARHTALYNARKDAQQA